MIWVIVIAVALAFNLWFMFLWVEDEEEMND